MMLVVTDIHRIYDYNTAIITIGYEPKGENGSIIFATSKVDSSQKQQTFNIGISGNGSTGSVSGFDEKSVDFDIMSSVWSDFQDEKKSIEGEIVLASICYSSNESGMSSLPTDFYKDVEGHMSELEEYDFVYLLKAEFTIGENGGDS